MWYSSGSPKLARTTCLEREHVELAAAEGTGGFVSRAAAAAVAVAGAAAAVAVAVADVAVVRAAVAVAGTRRAAADATTAANASSE